MLAHRLKYQIEVWENTSTKNSMGSVTKTAALVDFVNADVQASMGKVVANDDRVIHTNETTFIIRNYPKINYNQTIHFDGGKYKVMGIQALPDRTGQIIKTFYLGEIPATAEGLPYTLPFTTI